MLFKVMIMALQPLTLSCLTQEQRQERKLGHKQ